MNIQSFHKVISTAAVAVLSVVLVSCGGGGAAGGGGGNPPPPPQPPSITTQPTHQTLTAGPFITAHFSVAATGSLPFTYQWQKSLDTGATWINVGLNQPTLEVTGVIPADAGTLFRCQVTNGAGAVQSQTVKLTVYPNLLKNPGFEDGTSDWVLDGTAITQNNSTGDSHSGLWKAWMAWGTTLSQTVALPSDATTVDLGFWFSAKASPGDPSHPNVFSVIIQSADGQDLTTLATMTDINDLTKGLYVFKGPYDLSRFKGQTIKVTFKYVQGNPNSNMWIDLDDCSLSAVYPETSWKAPTIQSSPLSLALSEGYKPTFQVLASGPGILSYQWFKDGVAIPNATSSSLTIPGALLADAGAYWAVASTYWGSNSSSNAILSVRPWDRSLAIWPNSASSTNSDPWLVRFHDRIELMKPRVLYINFANGLSNPFDANRDNTHLGLVTSAMLAQKVQCYVHTWEQATRYQPQTHPNAKPFISPVVTLVDLRDSSGHANSQFVPGRTPQGEARLWFATDTLFGDSFTAYLGLKNGQGEPVNLARAFELGMINDVVVCLNEIDPNGSTPLDQCVGIRESYSVYACYDDKFNITSTVINFPVTFPLKWNGVSMRATSVNIARDGGSDGHGGTIYGFDLHGSPGHELEYRTGYFNFVPYFTKYFRRYVDADMDTRYGIAAKSLYDIPPYTFNYTAPDGTGSMTTLNAPSATPPLVIPNYRPRGGNVHFPPGADQNYGYYSPFTVLSCIETFAKPNQQWIPFNKSKWNYLNSDPLIVDDNGGKWVTYWCQNMPGYQNESLDDEGKPMKNWWVFWFY